MYAPPALGDVRGLRTMAPRTLVVLGVVVAALFSASVPARADLPFVELLAPNGGESLAGGSTFPILWNMTHSPDSMLFAWLDFSADGGLTYPIRIASGDFTVPFARYDWTVPLADSAGARIRVCARGSDGNQSCDVSAANFTIDSTPPYVRRTVPANGATNVSQVQPLVVEFSEEVDQPSFVLIPSPSVPTNLVWRNATTVEVFHQTFGPCTPYTFQAYARDLAGNVLNQSPAPNPWAFTTVCTNPQVVWTDPANGQVDVPLDAPVEIRFNGAMNQSSVSLALSPTAGNLSYIWQATLTVVVGHDPFMTCTNYTAYASGRDVNGSALVTGIAPNPWLFRTVCPSAPDSLTVISPVGGESWTGGSDHAIAFEVVNGDVRPRSYNVTARYASSAGNGFAGSRLVTVPGTATFVGGLNWTVPFIDATDVVLNVSAIDPGSVALFADSEPIQVDSTPPTVGPAMPRGPNAPMDPILAVFFSEAMNSQSAISDVITIDPPLPYTPMWSFPPDRFSGQLLGTQPCTSYTVTVGGNLSSPLRDLSDPGNPLAPFSWTFQTVCRPTVDLLAPDGGEDWTGETLHEIRWTTDDADDATLAAELRYSTDGGVTYPNLIASLVAPVGPASHAWTVPRIDAATLRVRIVVTDPAGDSASDASAGPFMIDSTPPTLLTSFPAPGSHGHRTTRQMSFTFSERVDRPSFEDAFLLSPAVGEVTMTWSASGGADVLTIAHDALRLRTEYAITFLAVAKDGSDPGNHLPTPLLIRFTTSPPPDAIPPVAKAVARAVVRAGEVVTLDGTLSTGDIARYEWRINDDEGLFVTVLVGRSASVAFPRQGRFQVTLVVADPDGLIGEDTVGIAVTPDPNGVLILAGVLALAAALVGTTEAGRASAFGLVLFPLYVRRKRNEVLEHQTRGMILGYVLVHPGDSYTDIKRNLSLSNGTLTYHLIVLERERIIRSQVRGPRKLFYPMTVRLPEDGGGLHELQLRMFRAVREVPGLAVKDLAGALGITSQHALYHLRALATKGFVRLERRGLNIRCFAEPGQGPPLHEADGPEHPE
ncbi:MAG TPA: Ig-like domain-containing protein [Thermoplasmata archaeon]|nr:Ig-like domain-containing protein [Thermoplasmata archaeon]